MTIERTSDKLIIKKRKSIHLLNIDEIVYIERCGIHSIINTLHEEVKLNNALKEILRHLPSEFVKTHRSFIINKKLLRELIILNEHTYEAIFSEDKTALVNRKLIKLVY